MSDNAVELNRDGDEQRALALLERDVVSTVGARYLDIITHYADSQREFATGDEYIARVAEAVQQYLMDTFVDTTWPACPRQPNHPLWFHEGAWCCSRDHVRIPLGQLPSVRRDTEGRSRDMPSAWQPIREPFRATATRTVGIALVVGGVVAWRLGRFDAWPVAAGLVLWFSLGGHWVELWFLNWLRPRLARARLLQAAARMAVWFLGGVGLGFGVVLTMRLSRMTGGIARPSWWVAGVAFVALELVVHLVLLVRRRANFYSGTG